jgi:nicotinic acid mononucleotide adenylyltransferase
MSAQKGHLEVAKTLLEAGGCELVMLMDNGASCLFVARHYPHGEVCRVLNMACQNAGLFSCEITILKRG